MPQPILISSKCVWCLCHWNGRKKEEEKKKKERVRKLEEHRKIKNPLVVSLFPTGVSQGSITKPKLCHITEKLVALQVLLSLLQKVTNSLLHSSEKQQGTQLYMLHSLCVDSSSFKLLIGIWPSAMSKIARAAIFG